MSNPQIKKVKALYDLGLKLQHEGDNVRSENCYMRCRQEASSASFSKDQYLFIFNLIQSRLAETKPQELTNCVATQFSGVKIQDDYPCSVSRPASQP